MSNFELTNVGLRLESEEEHSLRVHIKNGEGSLKGYFHKATFGEKKDLFVYLYYIPDMNLLFFFRGNNQLLGIYLGNKSLGSTERHFIPNPDELEIHDLEKQLGIGPTKLRKISAEFVAFVRDELKLDQ